MKPEWQPYRPDWHWRSIPQNLRFIYENPCNASPSVYVETAIPVLGEALLVLMTFGWSDIIIGYTRPKIRRGPRFSKGDKDRRARKSRDGRPRPGTKKGLPEWGNEIGKRLPGATFIQGWTDNKIGHLFWLPIDWAERGLYWWMIIDQVKEAQYEWASDIYKLACPKPSPALGFASWRSNGTGQTTRSCVPLFTGGEPAADVTAVDCNPSTGYIRFAGKRACWSVHSVTGFWHTQAGRQQDLKLHWQYLTDHDGWKTVKTETFHMEANTTVHIHGGCHFPPCRRIRTLGTDYRWGATLNDCVWFGTAEQL